MEAEARKMWELIGSLFDAFWRRLREPRVSPLDELRAEEYAPKSQEEKDIWSEITAPSNYLALLHFVESQKDRPITDYAARLYQKLLAEALRRQEMESGSVKPGISRAGACGTGTG